jgi:hypothetical protein
MPFADTSLFSHLTRAFINLTTCGRLIPDVLFVSEMQTSAYEDSNSDSERER